MPLYLIDQKAFNAIKEVYDQHIADELNFGEGKNRDMLIAAPMWAVEGIATGKKVRHKDPHEGDQGSRP